MASATRGERRAVSGEASFAKAAFIRSTSSSDISSRLIREFRAVSLTRITFPYLLLITLVTLWSGILNALHRFAAAAAAPILLNLTMMATLALAFWFPGAGYAAAWGVLISGILQAVLVGGDSLYAGAITWFRAPHWDKDVRRFFKALLPATLGSAGTQLALFADTIIASFLSAGAISAVWPFIAKPA